MSAPQDDEDLDWYGDFALTQSGQLTVPAEAQRELGLAVNSRVWIFGDRKQGRLIVTPRPPPRRILEATSPAGPDAPAKEATD